ncbi:MAG: ABC transporter ATP-binding protein [Bacteroidaceae bacterium]|nr:ABC transporter ATP-binding protein [Bacteroidaceae bacterium]
MLLIRSASLAFGDHVLFHDLNLHVASGQLVGLSGESGCGKTSLLRAVLGFLPLTSGEIEVCGKLQDSAHVDAIRRETSYVPQELLPLAPKGKDLVQLTHSLEHNVGLEGARSLASFMESLHLEQEVMELDTARLSGGQRQRLLLAAALSLHKPLLLLDEPTSALDEESSQRVGRVLQQVCHEDGVAALVVSHDPVMHAFCDTVVTLSPII